MNNNLEKAKKMFFDYGCNRFYMMKEGVEKEFEKFGVGAKREEEWRKEYVDYWVVELSEENLEPLPRLKSAGRPREILPKLYDLLNKGDSYVKFWIAHTILEFATRYSLIEDRHAKRVALQAFDELIAGPITINETNKPKIDGFMMFALEASTPENYILNYSKRICKDQKT